MAGSHHALRDSVERDAHDAPSHGCSDCPGGRYCLPLELPPGQCQLLDGIMRVRRLREVGRPLVRAGDPLQALYAVRSGCFKTVSVDPDGNERTVEFHLPSELLGMDAIHSGVHPSDLVALSAGSVCVFPYQALLSLAGRDRAMLNNVLRLFSRSLLGQMVHGIDNAADQRLAGFLLRLSLRLPPRGLFKPRFLLPMSRIDIASHLRIAQSTLSRLIARLQDDGLFRIDGRWVEIPDPTALGRAAGALSEISL